MTDPAIRLRVSEAKQNLIVNWGEGVRLENRSGQTIDQLAQRATADRLDLALDFRRRSRILLRTSPPPYRDVVSRLYYSMYHAARAVVFFSYRGDDNQDHRVLPANLPSDFVDPTGWGNKLKTARDARNRADYDPFPKSAQYWRREALALAVDVDEFIELARKYLRGKGCAHI
jgi:uncharacterized protein (UPF0332 family)